jgi:GT2 family glycosyltransferase
LRGDESQGDATVKRMRPKGPNVKKTAQKVVAGPKDRRLQPPSKAIAASFKGQTKEPTTENLATDPTGARSRPRDREGQLKQLSLALTAAKVMANQIAARLAEVDARTAAQAFEEAQRAVMQVELQAELAELRERVEEFETLDASAVGVATGRRRASAPFRETVITNVPPGARILVMSNGDSALLDLRSRKAQHFPQDSQGAFSGTQPASNLAAIAQLEAWRYRFVEPGYLAIPQAQFWWLEHYDQFARHLERRYTLVHRSETAIVYRLTAGPDPTWQAQLEELFAVFSACFDRDAAVLDWGSGLDIAKHFPEIAVFSPPNSSMRELPYLDGSVDVVVVRAHDKTAITEARRVAGAAVAQTSNASLQVEWVAGGRSSLPSISIVIPSYNGIGFTEPCIRSLIETVPAWLDAEFVVVDDCSTDGTHERLAVLARHEPRLRVLRNEVNSGFLMTCNRGAFDSRGEIVLWLNNDTLALPGWLPPLLGTFRQRPDAGAVGGKLLFPDGRLQEAGGVVFSDGRSANVGKWFPDPSDPLFDYVREVDYVSGAHLAFRRSFLELVGGFDESYRPIYCEDTDICFKVRQLGLKVYYQPESAIIHIEGGTSGTDESAGDKRYQTLNREVFAARWIDELRLQPTYPNRFDLSTLHRLAVRGET